MEFVTKNMLLQNRKTLGLLNISNFYLFCCKVFLTQDLYKITANESCICEERVEFERSSISYVQANCSFYETNLCRSFHKSNFAGGKRWVESLLSARFSQKQC